MGRHSESCACWRLFIATSDSGMNRVMVMSRRGSALLLVVVMLLPAAPQQDPVEGECSIEQVERAVESVTQACCVPAENCGE